MKSYFVDAMVGLFLIAGFIALGWLALQLGEIPWLASAKIGRAHV